MQKHNDKQTNSELTKEDILALDIATFTGYYSIHEAGTWNFTESKQRNDNKQHKDFRDTLIEFIRKYQIQKVVAEDVNVNNHFFDMRKLAEFRGILLEVCDELNLPEPEFVNVSSLKKWATGNGRACKNEMMEICQTRFNYHPTDDNEADAFLIFNYYTRKYRITA
ncbi:crossover junction endodeoxyribonuclease RuvC [Bacteroides fragilis]|nr:crossover junction endodeoxyribonuclease RuvC [Bacteroides fragilis]